MPVWLERQVDGSRSHCASDAPAAAGRPAVGKRCGETSRRVVRGAHRVSLRCVAVTVVHVACGESTADADDAALDALRQRLVRIATHTHGMPETKFDPVGVREVGLSRAWYAAPMRRLTPFCSEPRPRRRRLPPPLASFDFGGDEPTTFAAGAARYDLLVWRRASAFRSSRSATPSSTTSSARRDRR